MITKKVQSGDSVGKPEYNKNIFMRIFFVLLLIFTLSALANAVCFGPSEDKISGVSYPLKAGYNDTIIISCQTTSSYYDIYAASDAADNCTKISQGINSADFRCVVNKPYEKYNSYCIVCDPSKGDKCCSKKYVGTTEVTCNNYGEVCETDSQCCFGNCALVRSFGFLKKYCLRGYFRVSGYVKSDYGTPMSGVTIVIKTDNSESAPVLASTTTNSYGWYESPLIPSPYDYHSDHIYVIATKHCYNFSPTSPNSFALDSDKSVNFTGVLSGCECENNEVAVCGSGVCMGIKQCINGVWSSCSTAGKDCGVCCKCDSSGNPALDSSQTHDCEIFDLDEINTCNYYPDGNPFTRDFRPGFDSQCIGPGQCSYSYGEITHYCDFNCGAECTTDSDCPPTDCDSYDGCYNGIYRDYEDQDNFCIGCQCTHNSCYSYHIVMTDNDGDGYGQECGNDCDDNNPLIHPGAQELCDGIDNNCNGIIDEGCNIPNATIKCEIDGLWGEGHQFKCLEDNTYMECVNGSYGYKHINICLTRCSAAPVCNGSSPGEILDSCDYGRTFLLDKCDENCQVKDTEYCNSDHAGCTSDPECNGFFRGTENCDSECNYIAECSNGDTMQCGEGVCEGIKTCVNNTWSECSSAGQDCGVCCECNQEGIESFDPAQDSDCDSFDFAGVNTCNYLPDGNPYTLDYAPGFDSQCIDKFKCSTHNITIIHTCSIDCNSSIECDGLLPGQGNCTEDCQLIGEKKCSKDGLWGVGHEFMCLEDNTYLECINETSGYTHINVCLERCSAAPACNGSSPGHMLDSCNYGFSYLQDKCDENCQVKDTDYCNSELSGCTSDPECNGIFAGTGNCDAQCTYLGGECVPNQTRSCGEGACEGVQICTLNRTWGDCSSVGRDCGVCCICDANSTESFDSTQNSDCDSFDFAGINTCNFSPDDNPFTLDFAASFDSQCIDKFECSTQPISLTHVCSISECGAECVNDADCADSYCEQQYYDYCNGTRLVDYNNDGIMNSYMVNDSCTNFCEDCLCSNCSVNCTIMPPLAKCISGECGAECSTDADCPVTDCSYLNVCIGSLYYNYTNQVNSCTDNCSCTHNECGDFVIQDTDLDNDGYNRECENDCNDANPLIHPGAQELCDGLDNNCNGLIDEGLLENKRQQSIRAKNGELLIFNGYHNRPYTKCEFSGWVRFLDSSGHARIEIISSNLQNEEVKLYLEMENLRVLENNCKELVVETYATGTYYVEDTPYSSVGGRLVYTFDRLDDEVSLYMNESFDLRIEHMPVTFQR